MKFRTKNAIDRALVALREVSPVARLAMLVAVYVATGDEQGLSEAQMVKLVNHTFKRRSLSLKLARQEGKMPPERWRERAEATSASRPFLCGSDSEPPSTVDETTRPVVKAEETASAANSAESPLITDATSSGFMASGPGLCALCKLPESNAHHSNHLFPNTWHPFRAR